MNQSSLETSYVAIQRGGTASLAASIASQQVQNAGFMITSEEQLRREKRRQKKWTVLIAIVSLVGFFVALAAMIVEASTVAYLAFLFPLLTGPYVIHQRRKLNKLPTLVFVMNQLRDQINQISIQNSMLHSENTRMEKEVVRLHDAENKLQAVVDKSGHNVETICSLVKDNAEIQRQMKVRSFVVCLRHCFDTRLTLSFILSETFECERTAVAFDRRVAIGRQCGSCHVATGNGTPSVALEIFLCSG
jgi:hypothetical protein